MSDQTYLILDHHDEYYTDGYKHRIRIREHGTLKELHNKQAPNEPRNRSGLSGVKLTTDQFPAWFNWFTDELLYEESYTIHVSLKAEGITPLLTQMNEEYTLID